MCPGRPAGLESGFGGSARRSRAGAPRAPPARREGSPRSRLRLLVLCLSTLSSITLRAGDERVNSVNRSPTDGGSSDPAEVEPTAQEIRQPSAGQAPDVGVAATAEDRGGRSRPAPVGAGDDDGHLWEERR